MKEMNETNSAEFYKSHHKVRGFIYNLIVTAVGQLSRFVVDNASASRVIYFGIKENTFHSLTSSSIQFQSWFLLQVFSALKKTLRNSTATRLSFPEPLQNPPSAASTHFMVTVASVENDSMKTLHSKVTSAVCR